MAGILGALSWVAAVVLLLLAVPAYLLYTVRVAKGPRGPRAAYLFVVLLIGVIVGFMAAAELTSAAGRAIVGTESDCIEQTANRLAQEGTPPPIAPPTPTPTPTEFTPPPIPTPPSVTLPPIPIPTPPTFTFPPFEVPTPGADDTPNIPNVPNLGCITEDTSDPAAAVAHGGVLLLAAVGVIGFHARAARRLLDEEGGSDT